MSTVHTYWPITLPALIALLLFAASLPPTTPAQSQQKQSTDVYTSREAGTLAPTLSLRTINGVQTPFAYDQPWASLEPQPGRAVLDLAGIWKKERASFDHDLSLADRATALAQIEADGAGRHLADFDDSTWATITLPRPENAITPDASPTSVERYEGGVWYRRSFSVDASWQGQRTRLVFQAVNYVADVWVNGTWAGYHEGGYTPFALDVTELANYGSENVVVVRVDNPPWDTRTDIVPAVRSDWWNYTGIIQDVYLEALPPVYVARADVVPLDRAGRIQTTLVLHNAADKAQRLVADVAVLRTVVNASNLTDPSAAAIASEPVAGAKDAKRSLGMPPNSTHAWRVNLRIPQPALWTPASPNLYVLKVTLRDKQTIVDEFYTQFGLRTVSLASDAPKLLLNDHPVYFAGIARHEDWIDTGRTIGSIERIRDDLAAIKALNVNFLRTAHYPNHPSTYILTDRMGLAVAEEIPTWWFNAYHFADQKKRGIADQMWREMIFRDYNRPSIILWSGTNEAIANERRREFLTRINRDLKQNYYDGRLVTQSASTSRGGADDPSMHAVDVAGWTMYFGIFEKGPYYEGTRDFLAAAHQAFPTKPIFNTEFGFYATPDDSLALLQREVFDETFRALAERRAVDADGRVTSNDQGFLMTQTWWATFDWYTQIAGLNTFGAIKLDRASNRPVSDAIRDAYAPYGNNGGLATTSVRSRPVDIPAEYVAPQPAIAPRAPLLQDFEAEESYYNVFNAQSRLATNIVHSGKSSVKMIGTGEYNGVGAYLYQRPVDASHYRQLCVWAYDNIGGNPLRVRLLDADGGNQEIETATWTPRGEWTQICVDLAAFDQINPAKLERVQFTFQPSSVFYFDDVTLQ
jgi:beta-glucuronidase